MKMDTRSPEITDNYQASS